jgi:hypothetical protein
VSHLETERKLEAAAIRDNGPFVSQAALRKWYYDNIDIVDYTVRFFSASPPPRNAN